MPDRTRRTPSRTYLVEHYAPGVTSEEFDAAVQRVTDAIDARPASSPWVRLLHSTFVPQDEAAVCVFEAEDAADVARAYGEAGVAYDRIVEAVESDLPKVGPIGHHASHGGHHP